MLCLQSEVDSASDFAVVLDHFEEWMAARELGSRYSVAIVTDGSVLRETQGWGVDGVNVLERACVCVWCMGVWQCK